MLKFFKSNIFYIPLALAHTWINPVSPNIIIHKIKFLTMKHIFLETLKKNKYTKKLNCYVL